jgi:hypothetical protein
MAPVVKANVLYKIYIYMYMYTVTKVDNDS